MFPISSIYNSHITYESLTYHIDYSYDPALGRLLSPDPYVQLPDFTQNFNRYSYCLNNPLVYTDLDGENPLAFIIGATVGAYLGGTAANDWQWNQGEWDYKDSATYFGMVVGGVTNGLGSYGSAVWVDGLEWDSKEAFVKFGKDAGTGVAMGFSYTVVENKVIRPGVKRLKDFKFSFKFKKNEYNLNIKIDPIGTVSVCYTTTKDSSSRSILVQSTILK